MKDILHTANGMDCLSEQEMFDYLDNKLSPSENHRVEKHLLDCEMCTDALEGLSLVKDRNKIVELKEQVNYRLIHKSKEGKVVSLWNKHKVKFAIAASILMIMGIAGVYNFSKTELDKRVVTDNVGVQELAKDKTETVSPPITQEPVNSEKVSPAEGTAVSSSSSERLKNVEPEKKPLENISFVSSTEDIASDNNTQSVSVSDEESQPVAPSSQNVVISSTTAEEQISSKAVTHESFNMAKSEEVESKKKRSAEVSKNSVASAPAAQGVSADGYPKAKIIDSNYKTAMNYYQAGNYSEAVSYFEMHFNEDGSKPEALLYCGISYLNLEQADNAILKFDQLLNGKDKSFHEAATFHKALALIKKKDNQAAEALLKKVVDLNGEYKQKAEEILKRQ